LSLTGRFSALFLGALTLVLVAYSTALYVAARVYLDRELEGRLAAALAVLAAAAEIDPDGIEWEPGERVLNIGQEPGAARLRWSVRDDRGNRIDQSRNLAEADLAEDWDVRPESSGLVDRRGRHWRIAHRRIGPGLVRREGRSGGSEPPEGLHSSLLLSVCAASDPLEATLAALAWWLVGLSLAIWLLAALLCRRLSQGALTPLRRMVESARGLGVAAPGWCLEQAGTGGELDELGQAFNDLLARLHVAFERQRRFSGDASHQLRTPLTVLIGQLEVALRRERPGDEYRRVLRSALAHAVQLGQIVEALLFLARAEGEALLPGGEPLVLDRWVADHLKGRPAAGRAVEVVPRANEGEAANVWAHAALLGQLLDNLLDNACKYDPNGTPVRVEIFRNGCEAILAVEDHGPGIPAEDLSRVFEPFYRSAEARRRNIPGVGLGLAVVQRIAIALGGSVVVRSRPGEGCRVEVRLPIHGEGGHDLPRDP